MAMVAISYWIKLPAPAAGFYMLGPHAVIEAVLAAGGFTVAAWAMVLGRAGRLAEHAAAPVSMAAAALVFGLLCALPARPAVGMALLVLGVSLLRQPRLTPSGRQAGWLLLALAGSWISPELRPLHILAGHMDAQAATIILRAAGQPAVVHGNVIANGDGSIEILSGCASSWPLAQVGLAYFVVTIYLNGRFGLRQAPWLVASLLASVALTEIRLALCAASHENYLWWHDGPGVSIYELAGLALALLFPLLASAGQPRRQGGGVLEKLPA